MDNRRGSAVLDPSSRPKLRWPLDVQHLEYQGNRCVLLRDEEGVAPEAIVLPASLLPILARFDGIRSVQEILEEAAPFGLTEELLSGFIAELRRRHFLESPETSARWDGIRHQFTQQPVRPAVHAGRVYPAHADELRDVLSRYIRETEANFKGRVNGERILSMIAPHIDYQRGWKTYGAAYAALEKIERPDVIFLLGTCHQFSEALFHLTTKSFHCPLGTLPAATDVIESLSKKLGSRRFFETEIMHRREHSLELQLPFLAHRWASEGLPSIVPILVGSFHRFCENGRSPIDDQEVADLVGALSECAKELVGSGRRVLFYGGVDLAHVGMHFGDSEPVSGKGLEELERRDRELLNCVLTGDEDALHQHIAEDGDRRRICGYPSMYTMLAAMRRAGWRFTGSCLEYRQAVDAQSDCIVSFASAYWYQL